MAGGGLSALRVDFRDSDTGFLVGFLEGAFEPGTGPHGDPAAL